MHPMRRAYEAWVTEMITGDLTRDEIEEKLRQTSGGARSTDDFHIGDFIYGPGSVGRFTDDLGDMMVDGWDENMDYLLSTGVSDIGTLGGLLHSALNIDGEVLMDGLVDPISQALALMQDFENTRQELFFGGRTAALTGSMYRQVIKQGVGTLYNHQEVMINQKNQQK